MGGVLMKKYILIIFVFLLVFFALFRYSEYRKIEGFKNEVIDYLHNKGFASEEYSTPKYVKEEMMKGLQIESVEIIFNEEKTTLFLI